VPRLPGLLEAGCPTEAHLRQCDRTDLGSR
jgi:hypothetical protein